MTQIVYLASPIVLLAGALMLLALDLVTSEENRKTAYSIVAILVLLVSMMVLALTPSNGQQRVMGMLIYDNLTRLLWLFAHVTLISVIIIGKDYVKSSIQERGLYYSFYLLAGLAVELLMSTSDILMLFLSMDFLSVLTYVLTGYLRDDMRSIEAATKYLVYGAVLSALMAFGLSWLYGVTGTTDYVKIAAILEGLEPWPLDAAISTAALLPALVFVAAGLAYKVAAAPFHQWAPDAYEGAPISVTAFLAVFPKLAGLGAFLRISMVMLPLASELGQSWHMQILLATALISMTFGNLAGLWQDSLKRLMAYSSIAQIGYILLGIAIGTPEGYRSAIFFIFAYVLADLTVFAVLLTLPRPDAKISDLKGMVHQQPLLAIVFMWAVLSLTGIPGTGGFLAKFTLINAGLDTSQPWIVIVVVVNTVISLGYYWQLIHAVFTTDDSAKSMLALGNEELTLYSHSYLVPVISSFGIFLLGVMPGIVFNVIDRALFMLR